MALWCKLSFLDTSALVGTLLPPAPLYERAKGDEPWENKEKKNTHREIKARIRVRVKVGWRSLSTCGCLLYVYYMELNKEVELLDTAEQDEAHGTELNKEAGVTSLGRNNLCLGAVFRLWTSRRQKAMVDIFCILALSPQGRLCHPSRPKALGSLTWLCPHYQPHTLTQDPLLTVEGMVCHEQPQVFPCMWTSKSSSLCRRVAQLLFSNWWHISLVS